jgi:hypothetical protein
MTGLSRRELSPPARSVPAFGGVYDLQTGRVKFLD